MSLNKEGRLLNGNSNLILELLIMIEFLFNLGKKIQMDVNLLGLVL
jgi:hypothetical protein